jgi:hypothetical protein
VVRVDWQVAGSWLIRYVEEQKEAQHSLRQLEKLKMAFFLRAITYCHRGDRIFLQNVYQQDYAMSQSRALKSEQLLPQKPEYLYYTITHLPNLQLADCYWYLIMQNFETSRQDVFYSSIQQIFHIMQS